MKLILLTTVIVLLCGAKLYYTHYKKCNAWDKLKQGDKVWVVFTNDITGISSSHATCVISKTDNEINLDGDGWVSKKVFFSDLNSKQYIFY